MKLAVTAATLAATLTVIWSARAQPPEGAPPTLYTMPAAEEAEQKPIPAPRDAFELSVATGYTQGFGSLRSGLGMPSVATAGVGFDLGLGYRIDPRWAVLWAGQYQELTAERTAAARGFTSSIAAQYHFSPTEKVDPWLEFGAGYRFLWENPSIGPTIMTHGFELARARFGVDFRGDQHVAVGPVIGADATMFLFQDSPNLATNIADPRISTFVYAGLQGRFDIGGKRETSSAKAVAKR